jgi:toxin ParE1/3/4
VAKPVRLRRLAANDVDAAVDYFVAAADVDVATRFVGALETALAHIGRHPHNGSLRFSYELDIPQLRAWPISRFPYLVFYVERASEIDVWRVLHARRDIPATLVEVDED